VGPLVISKLLDRSHAVLSTLEGKQLTGIFHVCRLKEAWIRTDTGPANFLSQLSPREISNQTPPVVDKPLDKDYDIIKGKFSNGNLHLLVQLDYSNNGRQWINLGSNNECCSMYLASLKANNLKVQGSYLRFVNSFLQLC
jgi:hypothetical protein